MTKKAVTKIKKKASETKAEKSSTKALNLAVLNTDGKKVADFNIDAAVFDGRINMPLMHQAVVAYLANQRKGLACAKTRGEVQGSGRKPWRQKGTGRARFGSIRTPLWRGGGIVFGPKPHSHFQNFPKKMKVLAFKSALNAKLKDNQIVLLDDLRLDSPKTNKFTQIIAKLNLDGEKVHFVVNDLERNVKLAARNIAKVQVREAANLHTVDVLDCSRLVLTKNALETVQARVKKCLA